MVTPLRRFLSFALEIEQLQWIAAYSVTYVGQVAKKVLLISFSKSRAL